MKKNKGYKLKITQLNLPKPHHNIRHIEISKYATCAELHDIIQELYGLQDCHLWKIIDDRRNPTREVMLTATEFIEEYGDEIDHEILEPEDVLLGQFISKRFKTVYYEYDFGVSHEFKIEYAGLTDLADGIRIALCTKYEGFNLLENTTTRQQIKYMSIYKKKDENKLFKTIDWFETREEFEEWIERAFEPVDLEELNESINTSPHTTTLSSEPGNIELALKIFIDEYSLPFDVQYIKECIYESGQDGCIGDKKYMQFRMDIFDKHSIDFSQNLIDLVTACRNNFPHKSLDGQCPADLFMKE